MTPAIKIRTKDQVVMSKTNGQMAIAIPLFRIVEDDVVDRVNQYVISFNQEKPLAYALDCGEAGAMLMNASVVDNHLEFLGDL